MNKRIKLKKGILHKKCDENCVKYQCIDLFGLVTNCICSACRFQFTGKAYELCKRNMEMY